MMNSAIYRGTIRHRRFTPVENAFRYRLFFMFLDLAEMPAVLDVHPSVVGRSGQPGLFPAAGLFRR
jgi:DUF1365 family protein